MLRRLRAGPLRAAMRRLTPDTLAFVSPQSAPPVRTRGETRGSTAMLLEGNFVVEFIAAKAVVACACACARACHCRHRPFGSFAVGFIEQDEFAAKTGEHDFRAEFLSPLLIGIFAGLYLAFEVDLGAFAQILLRDFGQVLVVNHHAVPF